MLLHTFLWHHYHLLRALQQPPDVKDSRLVASATRVQQLLTSEEATGD